MLSHSFPTCLISCYPDLLVIRGTLEISVRQEKCSIQWDCSGNWTLRDRERCRRIHTQNNMVRCHEMSFIRNKKEMEWHNKMHSKVCKIYTNYPYWWRGGAEGGREGGPSAPSAAGATMLLLTWFWMLFKFLYIWTTFLNHNFPCDWFLALLLMQTIFELKILEFSGKMHHIFTWQIVAICCPAITLMWFSCHYVFPSWISLRGIILTS